jgi:hypothetical protein
VQAWSSASVQQSYAVSLHMYHEVDYNQSQQANESSSPTNLPGAALHGGPPPPPRWPGMAARLRQNECRQYYWKVKTHGRTKISRLDRSSGRSAFPVSAAVTSATFSDIQANIEPDRDLVNRGFVIECYCGVKNSPTQRVSYIKVSAYPH